MTQTEILTLVFAAIAAVSAIGALVVVVVTRFGKRKTGVADGSVDALFDYIKQLEEESVRESVREIDYARKSVLESLSQTNQNIGSGVLKYMESANRFNESSMQKLREMQTDNAARISAELEKQLTAVRTELKAGVTEMRTDLQLQFKEVREESKTSVESMRTEMQRQLSLVRADSAEQLDKMRATVDEKLSETLDKRVQAAFQHVSERLDSVQKGFGEMKELTDRVGNLNKMFSNVKTRGIWGEVALQGLLEQILTPDQYEYQHHVTPRSSEVVDFAIRMPGQAGEEVFLPVDAKFPLEDYYRLLDAGENGDKAMVEVARKALLDRVRAEARSISAKYIRPPYTTNFAVLYVPNEGLYAELLRDGGFVSDLQSNLRVTICGPTTVSALLNSLQMGFTTLKIQKKSGEIIKNMQAVRTDFEKFAGLIEKIRKQAQTVVNTVEDMENRNRILSKKLDKLGDDVPAIEGETASLRESGESAADAASDVYSGSSGEED